MKPQPASRSSFHFQMKCLAPCSRLTPGDLDDTCRTLKPSFRRIFPASARLLLDHVWTPCDLRIKWLPFQPTTENVNVIIVLSRSNSAHLHPARPARCPNRPFSVLKARSKTLQEWRVMAEKLRTQRFETLCGLSPKSLLCSPIFSKPPNPAVSGSELLGQYLWALRGLFSE